MKVQENKTDKGQKITVLKFMEDYNLDYSNIVFVNDINLNSNLVNYNFQVSEYFDIQINYQKNLLKLIVMIFFIMNYDFFKFNDNYKNFYYKSNFVFISKKVIEFYF